MTVWLGERTLCRKAARRRAEGNESPLHITPEIVVELLGAPHFLDEEMEERTKEPGVAIGLAWTPAGGEVLFVEASRMAGAGTLTLTGQLGEVMKESARAALSWFRAHAASFGADRSPPLTLVEWKSTQPIEIELVAAGGPPAPGGPGPGPPRGSSS